MKVQADVTLQKDRQNYEYKKILGNILTEIDTLEKLIENFLMLSKIDNNKRKEKSSNIEVDSLMIEIISEYIEIAKIWE